MRRAFIETLISMAEHDDRIIFLTGDLGFQIFDDYIARFGARYVNVGIAEAQMVCAAAGLAREGFRPVVYSIASFMTGRPYEQIRVNISYSNLSVIIVGAGGGYCYSGSGVTHHAPDDFGLMTMLPGMTVVAPGDPNELRELLPQMSALKGPSYIRIGKFGEPTYTSESPVVLGRARLLREGKKVCIICTGEMAPIVLDVCTELSSEGISPAVCQMHTIKPLDVETLNALAPVMQAFVVVEEAAPKGALWSSVLQWHAESEARVKIIRLGPPDAFALGNFRRDVLRRNYGFDHCAIINTCRKLWHEL